MIKRLLLVILIASISVSAFQQSVKVLNYQIVDMRRLHFGFTIGLNVFDYNFKRRSPGDTAFAQVIRPEPGFNVNIVSELKLNEEFSFRFLPGLVFGQRRITFLKYPNFKTDYGSVDVESNYLDFPFLIKYKGKRIVNFRPYLIGGTSIRYDMAARKNPKLDGTIEGTEVTVKMKPLDVYFEIGYGMDFYLTYFKFSTELKLCLGARNTLDSDLKVAGINGFTSKLILLNFHFE